MSFTIISGGKVITTQGFSHSPQLGVELGKVVDLNPGYVVMEKDRIIAVTADEMEARAVAGPDASIVDAKDRLVIPGYVDSHTHLSFAGFRDNELGMRLSGVPYLEILAAGGGILSTVRKTRAASEAELVESTLSALDVMLQHGTTTVEAKSGYGLTVEDELKQLRTIRRADEMHAIDIVSTFMGAHAIPSEYANSRSSYVDLVVNEMLPAVAEAGLAEFCDCFCEAKAFTLEESRRILLKGREYGLLPKLHADEITALGGAGLAAEVGAVSAEHLIYAQEKDLARMAEAGVVAVLLPATAFILRLQAKAPVEKMLNLNVPIAISTDYNPGTSPLPNMQLLQAFACYHYGLTPAQAFAASTINAAHALRRAELVGSLEPGKQADIVLLKATSLEFVPYYMGVNLVDRVYKKGELVYQNPGA